jgi:hypothetical protein
MVRLHEPAYKATFDVENTGEVFGGEVSLKFCNRLSDKVVFALQIPQLYVNFPPSSGEPPLVLKGFTNVEVHSGDKVSVTIVVSRYDLSIWDVSDQGWRKPKGAIQLKIGASSRDIRLEGSLP